jgi:hypothetical protein
MKAIKKDEIKLTGEQIVQKKLSEINALLKKADLSKIGIRN